jgi:hypothetical protein
MWTGLVATARSSGVKLNGTSRRELHELGCR